MSVTKPFSHLEDYGWKDETPSYSCAYLTKPIMELCTEFGAKKILDLGCGNGAMCRDLEKEGFPHIVGCDIDQHGITIGKRCDDSIRYQLLGVYDDPAELGEADFDVVICTEVIEHLYEPRRALDFAYNVLRPGGKIIISTPYHGYLKNLLICLVNKWDFHHHPLEDGGHIKFWSLKTMRAALEAERFRFSRFIGAGRLPYIWNSMIVVAEKAAD